MAYELPTANQFKDRFQNPVFNDLSNPYISALIQEASRFVDDSWFEEDYQTAILFLAAHNALSELTANAVGGIVSESLGDSSVSYATLTNSSNNDYYKTTRYGMSFLNLFNANQPKVLLI